MVRMCALGGQCELLSMDFLMLSSLQENVEFQSASFSVTYRDVAAMMKYGILYDGKAEAGSTQLAATTFVNTVEAIK